MATFVFLPPYLLAIALFAHGANVSTEEFRTSMEKTLPASLLLSALLCVGAWVLGEPVLLIFGGDYARRVVGRSWRCWCPPVSGCASRTTSWRCGARSAASAWPPSWPARRCSSRSPAPPIGAVVGGARRAVRRLADRDGRRGGPVGARGCARPSAACTGSRRSRCGAQRGRAGSRRTSSARSRSCSLIIGVGVWTSTRAGNDDRPGAAVDRRRRADPTLQRDGRPTTASTTAAGPAR